jgi:hypothetical protein
MTKKKRVSHLEGERGCDKSTFDFIFILFLFSFDLIQIFYNVMLLMSSKTKSELCLAKNCTF